MSVLGSDDVCGNDSRQCNHPRKLRTEVPFSRLDSVTKQPNGSAETNGIHRVNVIHGLLDLVLASTSVHDFDARLSACECIKAYFYKHIPIRMHFLRRAIEGHVSGEDEVVNILTTLIDDSDAKGQRTLIARGWLRFFYST
jgi:hypothetical protein